MAGQERQDFRQMARALGTVLDFPAGEVIFRENDPPRYMYLVLSGSVEVSVREKVIETIHQGQAVGLLSLLDEQPRTITARTREPCELALMDKKKFRYMVEEIPNFVWFVMAELGTRLRAANAAL